MAQALTAAATCDPAAVAAKKLERALGILDAEEAAPLDKGLVRWPLAQRYEQLGRTTAAITTAQQALTELVTGPDVDAALAANQARAWLAKHR